MFALGVVTALAVTDRAEQRAIARAQAQASAATSVTVFLLAVILFVVLAAVVVVVGWQWWQQRQKQARLWEAMQQAQVYSAMQGNRLAAPRGGVRRVTQGQPNIIVVQQPEHQAVQSGRWEVLE